MASTAETEVHRVPSSTVLPARCDPEAGGRFAVARVVVRPYDRASAPQRDVPLYVRRRYDGGLAWGGFTSGGCRSRSLRATDALAGCAVVGQLVMPQR